MTDLNQKRCVPCEGKVAPLDAEAIETLSKQIHPRWKRIEDGKVLQAQFDFKNYWHTTAFVNAVAYVAHREDHHPDIAFGYKQATVKWWTHAAGGLTENDFICAAKVDALVA